MIGLYSSIELLHVIMLKVSEKSQLGSEIFSWGFLLMVLGFFLNQVLAVGWFILVDLS